MLFFATVVALASAECAPGGLPTGHIFAGTFSNQVAMLDIATGKNLFTFVGHTGDVRGVAVHGDNLFSGAGDNTTKMWSIRGQKLVRTFKGHTNGVNSVALSADGKFLFTASDDGTAKQWDVSTGDVVTTFGTPPPAGQYNGIGGLFVTDDNVFTGGYDTKAHQWSISTGKLVKEFVGHTDPVESVFVDSGKLYTASMDNYAKQWDLESGKCTATYHGHKDTLTTVYVSNGKVFVGGWDSKTVMWDVTKPRIAEKTFKDAEVNADVVIGDYLYTGSDNQKQSVRMFSITTGKVVKTFETPDNAQALAVVVTGCMEPEILV